MHRIPEKVPQSLIDLYRIALKVGAKLESFYEGDTVHIWTRTDPNRTDERFWAILSPDGIEIIEDWPKYKYAPPTSFSRVRTVGSGPNIPGVTSHLPGIL